MVIRKNRDHHEAIVSLLRGLQGEYVAQLVVETNTALIHQHQGAIQSLNEIIETFDKPEVFIDALETE